MLAMKTVICAAIALTALFNNVCYAGPLYVAEGHFVVDDKTVAIYVNENTGPDSYENKRTQALVAIQEDVYYYVYQVNKLLSSLLPFGLNVEVRIKTLSVLRSNLFPAAALDGGDVVTDSYALKYFNDYLISQQPKPIYDFAVLLTGFNIFGPGQLFTTSITRGYTCHPKLSIAVVEYNATYVTALATAQAIAFLLGASSDGAASDFIMSPANNPGDAHRWNFTQCTATDIQQFIPGIIPNCLLDTSSASIKPSFSFESYRGRLLDHNTICKRYINDTRSYTCKASNLYNNQLPKGDAICKQLYCRLPGTPYCTPVFTSDGLICDTSKRCDKGRCVYDSSSASASVDTNCVLGNQQVLDLPNYPFYGSCQQFISQESSSVCYNGNISNWCCATCKNYNTGPQGCEYGDQNSLCGQLELTTSCAPQNRAVCCYTCRNYVGKRSTDEDRLVKVLKDDSRRLAHSFDAFEKAKPEAGLRDFFNRNFG